MIGQVLTSMRFAAMGGVGGMLPTMAQLASTYVAHPSTGLPESGMYYGLIIFFILGVIICIGFSVNEMKQALITGIAAPAIITSIVSGAVGPPKKQSETSVARQQGSGTFFSPSAFAAPEQLGSDETCIGRESQNTPGTLRIRFFSDYVGYNPEKREAIQVKIQGQAARTCTIESTVAAGRQVKLEAGISGLEINYKGTVANVMLDPTKDPDILVVIDPKWGPIVDFLFVIGGEKRFDIVGAKITAVAYPGEYSFQVRFAGALARGDIIAVAGRLQADGWKQVSLPQDGGVYRDAAVRRSEIWFNSNSPADLTAATIMARTVRQFNLTPQTIVPVPSQTIVPVPGQNIVAKFDIHIYLP